MNVDVTTITDLKELKSLAYDQIAAKEVAQNNLSAINNRIGQLTAGTTDNTQATDPTPLATDEDLGIEDDNTKPDEVE